MSAQVLATARDVVVLLGGLIGLAWAIYRYWKTREAATCLQIGIVTDVMSVDSVNLVHVVIEVKNTGKVAVFVDRLDRCTCGVRKITCQRLNSELQWDGDSVQDLISPVPYMRDWENEPPGDAPMIFEPSVTEIFHVAFSTDFRGPLWIRAILIDKEEYSWRGERIFVLN